MQGTEVASEPAPLSGQFNGLSEFQAALHAILPLAHLQLQMFDPDFSAWRMNDREVTELLRQYFLRHRQARLQMVMHNTRLLEQQCPRFLLLLREFSHCIECKCTPKNLSQLTDSFCIADGKHIVRRFHCDWFRGESSFDSPAACALANERFTQIWDASEIGLQASVLGL